MPTENRTTPSVMPTCSRTAFGTPKDEFANDPHIHDVVPSEWLAWSPVLAAILIFGVAPGLMFDITEKALVALHLGA